MEYQQLDDTEALQTQSNITRLNLNKIIRKDIKLLWTEKLIEKSFIDFKVPLNLKNSSYIRLETYRYVGIKEPKGVMIFFHGYTDDNSETDFIAKTVSEVGLIYVAFDSRGHGNSEGKRTYFDSIDQLITDAKLFIKKIKELYPNLPLFIGGLSMGGLISYYLSLESPTEYEGVIMFAPALKTRMNCCLSFISALTGCLCPCISLKLKGDGKTLARNEEVRDRIKNSNSNVYFNFGTSRALIRKMNVTERTFSNYNANFVIFIGGNDKLVDPNCAFSLINQSKSSDKHLYYYEEMFHYVTCDDETFDIMEKVKLFISKRLRKIYTK